MTIDLFGHVSTLDTGERSDFDFYETPSWMTYALLRFHPAIRGATVLECCAGRNAITNVLHEARCTVHTNDLDRRHAAETRYNAASADYWGLIAPPVDWVITNPPFNVAMDILPDAFTHARVGVAFLLRKTFLEPVLKRGPWLSAYPPSRILGLPRHNFRGDGSGDSVSCDWMLWERRPDRSLRPFEINHLAESLKGAW